MGELSQKIVLIGLEYLVLAEELDGGLVVSGPQKRDESRQITQIRDTFWRGAGRLQVVSKFRYKLGLK
jgi:hypothetical protein